MKVKTHVKAGGLAISNRCETFRGVKPPLPVVSQACHRKGSISQKGATMKVKTHV